MLCPELNIYIKMWGRKVRSDRAAGFSQRDGTGFVQEKWNVLELNGGISDDTEVDGCILSKAKVR
jgi:hypothetical protein